MAGVIGLTALAAAAVIWLLGSKRAQAEITPADAEPVNPDATPEARELLKKLAEISGRYTLTGQQNFAHDRSRYSDRVYELTGKHPAIFGQDFGFSSGHERNSFGGRLAMIEEVKRQHRKGAVIALTWHAARPGDDEPLRYEENVLAHLTDSEWNEILTPGTSLHSRWVEQVDVIADYLRRLQEAGVPVLFRPYHEMNAQWFWWSGRPGERGSAALYKQIYERYVNVHCLNNLIWVWNVNSPGRYAGPVAPYYPGPQFADILSMDNYGQFRRRYYEDMLELAGSKPIALAEVGAMPSLDVLAKQPRWAYFMIWRGFAEEANAQEQLRGVFHAPNVLNPAMLRSQPLLLHSHCRARRSYRPLRWSAARLAYQPD